MSRAIPGRLLRARDTRVYPTAFGEYSVEPWRVESTFVNTGTPDPQYGESIREGELLIPQTFGGYVDVDASDRSPQAIGRLAYVVRNRDDDMRLRWEARGTRIAGTGISASISSVNEATATIPVDYVDSPDAIARSLDRDDFGEDLRMRNAHGYCYDATYRSLLAGIPFLLGCADGLIGYFARPADDGLAEEIVSFDVPGTGEVRDEALRVTFSAGDGAASVYVRAVRVAVDRRDFLRERGL